MKKLIEDFKMFFKIAKHIDSLARGMMILKTIRAIFSAISPFINIYMSARIIDLILDGAEMKKILIYAGITVALNCAVQLVSSLLSHILGVKNCAFINNYEKSKKFKCAELDYYRIESVETKKILNKIYQQENYNGGGIIAFYNQYENLIYNIFTLIFSVSLAVMLFVSPYPSGFAGISKFIANPFFGLGVLAVMIFHMVFSSKAAVKTQKYRSEQYQAFAFVNQFWHAISESAEVKSGGAMNVRIYNQNPMLIKVNKDNHIHGVNSMRRSSSFTLKNYTIPVRIIKYIMEIGLYTFAAVSALVGRITVGAVTQYVSAISRFSNSLSTLFSNIEFLRFNNQFAKLYFDFIEIRSEMVQGSLPVEKRDDREYEVEFRNVSFQYPGTEAYALKDVNFKFQVGQRLAVVGMNGSGKTTFIKLMCRLYDPTEGQILLNGIDIRKYDYKEYFSIFSIVFQDFALFAFPLGKNVAAEEEYDSERATKYLCEAGFGERIKTLPKGLETYLYRNFEKDGVEISGGEAQKIALARALYKDAPFIILDEPTAALDPIAEAEIYSKFDEIVGDKTAIYISHRLSSCRFCEKIAVFDGGRVIQTGTHDELVSDESGKYYELWQAQAQYYNEKAE